MKGNKEMVKEINFNPFMGVKGLRGNMVTGVKSDFKPFKHLAVPQLGYSRIFQFSVLKERKCVN